MVFRKLGSDDHRQVLTFLKEEPEINLFIIGDIENYGYESSFQTLWGVLDSQQGLNGVLLRYYNSFIPYSYEREVLKRFAPLVSLGAGVLSGKTEIIAGLKPYLTVGIESEKRDYFSRMVRLNEEITPREDIVIKKAGLTDIDRILNLRGQIEEFSSLPVNRDSILKKLETGSGRIYYCEDRKGRMISTAATSAENTFSAMVVGVATLTEYRQQGLATACVYRLCVDLLKEHKTPCLFYDDPRAGSIYRRMGFREIGKWSILGLTN